MEIRTQVLDYLASRIQVLRAEQQQRLQAMGKVQQMEEGNNNNNNNNNDDDDDDTEIQQQRVDGGYQNIAAIRSNTMKFLPNFFSRHQLSRIFICFPDPHFKARKHKARIISESLNAEYAYLLRPGGLLYTITDVEEYHYWVLEHFGVVDNNHDETTAARRIAEGVGELWERVSEEQLKQDECMPVLMEGTEEAKKVTRNGGNKYVAVFRRKDDPEWV